MNGNKYLLDTNIVIEAINNSKLIPERIDSLEYFCISTVVLGELYTGIYRVKDKEKHLKRLNNFIKNCDLFKIDSITSDIYGEYFAALLNKGRPIPTNDVWIAASAKQHGLTLITRDKHFAEIGGLKVEFW